MQYYGFLAIDCINFMQMSGKFTFIKHKTPEIGGISAVSLPLLCLNVNCWYALSWR